MKQYKVDYETFTVRERKQTMELPFGTVNHMLCGLVGAQRDAERNGRYAMAAGYDKLRNDIYKILDENGYYDNLQEH